LGIVCAGRLENPVWDELLQKLFPGFSGCLPVSKRSPDYIRKGLVRVAQIPKLPG